MSLRPWVEEFPDRVDAELEALDRAGIPYVRDNEAWATGVLRLTLRPRVNGEELLLMAEFPDLYPYARFEVTAPDLRLPHHQNPFHHNLCLLPRGSEYWVPSDTLAGVLSEQLPKLLLAGRSDDKAVYAEIEEQQGEPITAFYTYERNSIVFSDAPLITADSGELELLLAAAPKAGDEPFVLRGAITTITDRAGTVIFQTEQFLKDAFHGPTVTVRWRKFDQPINTADPAGFISEFPHPRYQKVNGTLMDVRGFVFPDETGWREMRQSWVFLVRTKSDDTRRAKETGVPRTIWTYRGI